MTIHAHITVFFGLDIENGTQILWSEGNIEI